MNQDTFAEAFVTVMDYCEARDAVPLNKHDGCFESDIDQVWSIAVNAHRDPVKCSRGALVLPFHCAVFWRGLLCGFLHPYGGEFVAHENANEDLFIAAVREAREGAAS